MLAVGHQLEAVVDSAEVGDAALAEDLVHVLAAGAEEAVLSLLIVGEQPGQGRDHRGRSQAGDDAGGVDVKVDGAAGEQLEALGHVAAGELVVVVNGDLETALAALLEQLGKASGGTGVVALLSAVAAEDEFNGLAGSVAGVVAGVAGIAAGGKGEDHGERKDECKDLLHFLSPFLFYFSFHIFTVTEWP